MECMWALVIVPLAVVAIAHAVTAGQMQALETLSRERAGRLANDLMEEILSVPYDPENDDGVVESDRWLYDDATDYSGFSETATAVHQVDRVGLQETDYPEACQTYSRSVTMSECECGGGTPACSDTLCEMLDSDDPPEMHLLTITVTVTDGEREMAKLIRLKHAEIDE